MVWARRLLLRLHKLFRRSRWDQELQKEIQFHLESQIAENVSGGMRPEEARHAAIRLFGNATQLEEQTRETWGWIWLEQIGQDIRYGVRLLFRNKVFTALSIFALALGIGINAAAFTTYKAFVARPLDARDPSRMINLSLTLQSGADASKFSYPDYEAYRDELHTVRGVIACAHDQLTLTDAGGIVSGRSAVAGSLLGRLGLLPSGTANAEFADTLVVSENYFSVLGVPVLRGRTFESFGAHELASSPVVLISENYWRRRFASDSAVIGRTIRLSGAPFVIIGITPHDFVGTSFEAPDFWLPLSLEPLVHPDLNPLHDREDLHLRLFGRLAPGATKQQAQAEANLVASRLRSLHESTSEWSRPVIAVISPGSPLPSKLPRELKLTILLIMVAVGMVLVIACANVASLQLARSTARQNELRLRSSLGASRVRILRQLLTESGLQGFIAGLVALPCTWAILGVGVNLFAKAFPAEVGTPVLNVTPNLSVFAYVLTISVFAGLLFGLAPAIESSSELFSVARTQGGSSPIRTRRLREMLIASQVAVSLVLLIAGGSLIHSSLQALGMPTGYESKRVVDLNFRFPERSRFKSEKKLAVARELRARIASTPGVVAVTSARAPDDNDVRAAAVSLNGENPTSANKGGIVYFTWVEPNYFSTLGVAVVLGKGFAGKGDVAEHSVLVSESAARQLWPGQNPLGRNLRLGTNEQFHEKDELIPDGPSWRVIGVAGDTRGVEMDGSDAAQVYLPLPEDRIQDYSILIRTAFEPTLVSRSLDNVVASVNSDLIVSTSTLNEMLRQTPPFVGTISAAAIAITVGLFGLLLASMGIYGTISYVAVLRTREVGIRMAVGAQKADILRLLLWESTRPVIAGLISGMFLAVGSSYMLRGVLYGVRIVDGVSFLGGSILFLAIALLATLWASQWATRVDPVVALRYE
jgi:predicted permease